MKAAETPDTAGGAIIRLNPSDGLFLRAEHLRKMQDYARDLTLAVGLSGGPGVVFGLTCALEADKLVVKPGLAIDPNGRPLRSAASMTVALAGKETELDDADFFVVEIDSDSSSFGSEGVYGALCADPCGDGSTIRPYTAEGLKVSLRKDTLVRLGNAGLWHRRSALASAYFERERVYGGHGELTANQPWLLPLRAGGPVGSILDRPWFDGTGDPPGSAVPLAVLLRVDGDWVLDVWTARRDVADPPPRTAWQWRLGMRPWSAFMAQLLQFQAQLADESGKVAKSKGQLMLVGTEISELKKIDPKKLPNRPAVEAVLHQVIDAVQFVEPAAFTLEHGFEELPPAGYVKVRPGFDDESDEDALAAELRPAFGNVNLSVRLCRPDHIAHAIEEAQHMDRIPLGNPAEPWPEVEVLVPQRDLVDLAGLKPDQAGYGWVAFVRRREPQIPEPAIDQLDVYLGRTDGSDGDLSNALTSALSGDSGRFKRIGAVAYPARQWAVPVDEGGVYAAVQDALNSDLQVRAVVGLASSEDRRPLAAARAARLVMPSAQGDPQARWVPTFIAGDAEKEAIYVLIGPPEVTDPDDPID